MASSCEISRQEAMARPCGLDGEPITSFSRLSQCAPSLFCSAQPNDENENSPAPPASTHPLNSITPVQSWASENDSTRSTGHSELLQQIVTPPISPPTPAHSLITPNSQRQFLRLGSIISDASAPSGCSEPFNRYGRNGQEVSCSPEPQLPRWSDLDDVRSATGAPEDEIAPQAPKYDFRPAPRFDGRPIHHGWIDQDATETYDPKGRHDPYLRPPDEVIQKQKRPRPERAADYDENRPKIPRITEWQQGRRQGRRNIVTFKFQRPDIVSQLKAAGDSLTHWPDEHYNHLIGDGEGEFEDDSSELEYENGDSYTLRQRRDRTGPGKSNDDWNLDLQDLTLGHPAARGCKGCFELNQRCPLLDEGSRYPCSLCEEDDMDCALVMEPWEKARCKNCTRRKIVCSFAGDPGARGPCRACNDAGQPCFAGPKSGRTRIGPSYNEEPKVPKARSIRAAVTCTACRSINKWCSLKSKRAKPPCQRCEFQNLECSVEAVATKPRTVVQKPKASPTTDLSQPLSSFARTETRRLLASTKRIVTKLAHPIRFNYHARLPSAIACHWCDDLLYGLLGLGEVRPEVIDNNDGQGYIEVSGGHRAAGFPASHMCDVCTLDRIMVVACVVHELEPIPDMNPDQFSFDIVSDYMEPGRASSAAFQWCSICPAPAVFRCCKQGDVPFEDGGMENQNGCGLVLCEFCAVTLVGEHDGSLESLINNMKRERAADGFGLRADVEFLHPDGELLRRMTFAGDQGSGHMLQE